MGVDGRRHLVYPEIGAIDFDGSSGFSDAGGDAFSVAGLKFFGCEVCGEDCAEFIGISSVKDSVEDHASEFSGQFGSEVVEYEDGNVGEVEDGLAVPVGQEGDVEDIQEAAVFLGTLKGQ